LQIADEGKITGGTDLGDQFDSPAKAAKMVKLLAFSAFEDTASAVAAAADMVEGKMGKVSALLLCCCVHSSDCYMAMMLCGH
jgi:NOP5NT (NUC127) domain